MEDSHCQCSNCHAVVHVEAPTAIVEHEDAHEEHEEDTPAAAPSMDASYGTAAVVLAKKEGDTCRIGEVADRRGCCCGEDFRGRYCSRGDCADWREDCAVDRLTEGPVVRAPWKMVGEEHNKEDMRSEEGRSWDDGVGSRHIRVAVVDREDRKRCCDSVAVREMDGHEGRRIRLVISWTDY